LARHLEMLLRHRLRFLLLLLIAPLALGGSGMLVFRTYQATASLWIESPSYLGQSVAPVGWNLQHSPAQNEAEILRQLLATSSFDESVGAAVVSAGTISGGDSLRQLIDSLGSDLKITPVGSHLVRLTYSNARPALAVVVLQSTIDLFEKHLVAAQLEQQDLSSTFLSAQVAGAESRLAVSEEALNTLLSAHPELRPPGPDETGSVPELDRLAGQVRDNQANLVHLRTQLDQARFDGAAAQRAVETNTKVVDKPHVTQTGPAGDGDSLRQALAVALLWIAAAIGYLVVLVWADQTARDGKELERRLKVPVLTTIPLIHLQERS
jgi:uncharacterized protein involved in exopolysaccharide biosynthesis